MLERKLICDYFVSRALFEEKGDFNDATVLNSKTHKMRFDYEKKTSISHINITIIRLKMLRIYCR